MKNWKPTKKEKSIESQKRNRKVRKRKKVYNEKEKVRKF
jgi:hypothetical protein